MKAGYILGISGRMGVGKSTAGEILSKYGYQQASFAHSLKRMVAGLLDVPVEMLEERDFKNKGSGLCREPFVNQKIEMTVREVLEQVATKMRELSEDFFIDALDLPDGLVVITDVRYPNEVEWIRSTGGIVIRLTANNLPPQSDHISNIALDHYGLPEVNNPMTLEGLENNLIKCLVDLGY